MDTEIPYGRCEENGTLPNEGLDGRGYGSRACNKVQVGFGNVHATFTHWIHVLLAGLRYDTTRNSKIHPSAH
jgi:hypothetical protein